MPKISQYQINSGKLLNAEVQLKQFRAITTRCDKTARNFLAAVCLAAATIWLN